MTFDEAENVNVLLRAVYKIGWPGVEDAVNGPPDLMVQLAAHDLAAKAYKKLGVGIHPAEIQKAERRQYRN